MSNLIKGLKEESFREDTNPAVSTVNLRECSAGVRRTGSGVSLPCPDSAQPHTMCVTLNRVLTLCIVVSSVKLRFLLSLDNSFGEDM